MSASGGGPRICMPTFRNFTKRAFRCGLYEAQDVLREIDNVDLICLDQGWGARLNENWLRMPLYHDVTKTLVLMNPGLQKIRLTREYDLFVAVCQDFSDLPYINAIGEWKKRCKTSVCWIDEVWAASIPGFKCWFPALQQFDHVFIGCRSSVAPLSNAIGRPCYWLPGAVDLLRFSPYPDPPSRVIDVYSIGRRWEDVHRTLLRAERGREIFYIYDTFGASNAHVYDHQQHRELYAQMAKRSRYFTVAPGKMNDRVTQGQVEVGYRYYEGAAAGAVMVGGAPDCEAFRESFPWPDTVISVDPDGSDVLAVLHDLDSDPNRLLAIQQRNAEESLLRHDWVYRWKEMFRVVGIDPLPGMAARAQRLKELAGLAANRALRVHRNGGLQNSYLCG